MHRLLAIAAVVLWGMGVPAASARAGISFGTVEEDPRLAEEKWKRKAEEDYKAGIQARAAGKKGRAVKCLMQAFRIGRRTRIDSPYPQKAADALEDLAREGLRELDVARDLVAGEAPRAGLLELKRIMRTYLGLPPARQAGTLLRQLQSDPAFQARLRQAQLAEQLDRAEALEARAAALAAQADVDDLAEGEPGVSEPAEPTSTEADAANAEAGNEPPLPKGVDAARVRDCPLTPAERAARRLELLAEAHALYARLAETAEGTEVGHKADAARRRLEQDSRLLARIRRAQTEDQAREWLGLGTNYMRAGRLDKAREYFEKVLAECPGTPQAREARGYLDDMSE